MPVVVKKMAMPTPLPLHSHVHGARRRGVGSCISAAPGCSTRCKAPRALSEEQGVRRRAPVEKSNLFNAYFEPFTQDDKEKELVVASGEQYSLDQVIYRSNNGRLLDVQHDMEVSRELPERQEEEALCEVR